MINIVEFEKQARTFLDANAPVRSVADREWGVGSDVLSSYAARSADEESRTVVAAKQWKQLEFDTGFGWITGPAEQGGAGLTAEHERVYQTARNDYDVPPLSLFAISLGMVAPTFAAFGGPVVVPLVPQMFRGDLVGCQLFSEPGNGSDVAGLTTKARRDGEEWTVTGQKVWTSVAHHSQWGLLLARSNPNEPKHKGITAFAVDMSLPGIEVRPLKMITGGNEFNEVFFDNVRISDAYRLGEVDKGWTVAIATLMNERALGAGGNDVFGVRRAYERLLLNVRATGMDRADPLVRQELAAIYSMIQTVRYQSMASDERRKAGLPPGPAESIFKLANTETMRRIVAVAGNIVGASAVANTGEWGTYCWGDMILTTAALRIAGGTDEVLRNILAERVLGMPKEPGA